MKKVFKWTILIIVAILCIAAGYAIWILEGAKTSNPDSYKTIGEIATPWGYSRISGDDSQFTEFLRSLPLKEKGAKVQLYTGGDSRFQSINYAVVDMPLLSNDEQCADVCMRLRAEYLYDRGKYGSIHFENVNGKTMSYGGGGSRKAFESYMRRVYGVASTYSLKREMKQRSLSDIQPGDVFVYAAGDHDLDRKLNSKYGHAIMVVDVAENSNGKRAFLLVEGNTPARNIHVLRNLKDPFRSPWFFLDGDEESFFLSVFYYKANELKYW